MAFDKIPHDQWISKVKKELKLDSLSTKQVPISESLTVNPFFEREIISVESTRKEKLWNILFRSSASKVDNAILLDELQGGVNHLRIDHSEEIEDLHDLFDQIEFSFIHATFSYSEAVCTLDIKDLIEFIESKNAGSYCTIIINSLDEAMIEMIDNVSIKKQFEYEITSEDVTAQLTWFAEDFIAKNDQLYFENSTVVLSKIISNNIIQELGIKHAMDVLIQNIDTGYKTHIPPINFHANCYREAEVDLEKQFILLSSKGLTAALASYNSIFIDSSADSSASFNRRISRNIHHLLQMESFIQHSSEAYKGSYQIEKIGEEIAEEVFKKL